LSVVMCRFAGPLALGLALVSETSAAAAGSGSAALTVSVQVARGCTVRTDLAPATLDCGRRERGVRVVRVAVDRRAAEFHSVDHRPVPLASDAPARTLTINF
jgi:hypothetical protein